MKYRDIPQYLSVYMYGRCALLSYLIFWRTRSDCKTRTKYKVHVFRRTVHCTLAHYLQYYIIYSKFNNTLNRYLRTCGRWHENGLTRKSETRKWWKHPTSTTNDDRFKTLTKNRTVTSNLLENCTYWLSNIMTCVKQTLQHAYTVRSPSAIRLTIYYYTIL